MLYNFNESTATAAAVCLNKADYYTCLADRRYGTKDELDECPEWEAAQKLMKAACSVGRYAPSIAKELMAKAEEYENSTLTLQKPIEEINWCFEDGTAISNAYLGKRCTLEYYGKNLYLVEFSHKIAISLRCEKMVKRPGRLFITTEDNKQAVFCFAD